MLRIVRIVPPSAQEDDSVRLDRDQRLRRRMVYATRAGERILLDMPQVVHLRDGDGLELEDGRIVRVDAALEDLLEITAVSAAELVRIAWHLGNRHLPTQLLPGENGGCLRIRADHVIGAMAEGLGGKVASVSAAFDPEGGAYATGGHGHDGHHHDRHHHDHGHHHRGHAHD